MGAAFARDAPPLLQTLVATVLRTRLELALAGLDGAGKTTLVSVLQAPHDGAQAAAVPPPTIGLVVHSSRYRGVALSMWDLGGQNRFRSDWGRHLRGCGALLFVVDCTDEARYPEARQALQRLLEEPEIGSMPLLVIATKVDLLPPQVRAAEELRGWPTLVDQLHLDSLPPSHRWSVLGVSATRAVNVDKVLRWLVLQAHGAAYGGGADEADADADADAGGGVLSWSWWSGGRRKGARSRWSASWARRRGFTLLADASKSLLAEREL